MTVRTGYLPDFLGGTCTIPVVNRRANEVSEARNVLFSRARGAYRRPPVVEEVELLGVPTHIDATEDSPRRPIKRAMWCFPVRENVLQVVMVRHLHWEMFWVDLKTHDFLRGRFGNPIDHTGSLLLDNPSLEERAKAKKENREISITATVAGTEGAILTGESDYLRIPTETDDPHEAFRVIRVSGRILILNRNMDVRYTARRYGLPGVAAKPSDGNKTYDGNWLIYFVAITSGLEAKIIVNWTEGAESKKQEVSLGEASAIETAGQRFANGWTETAGFALQGRRNTALLSLTGTPDIKEESVQITSENCAIVVVANEGTKNESTVPSFQALPPIASDRWRVKVTGNVQTRLDDVWVEYKPNKEEG